MKNIYEVLKEKEAELLAISKQCEALKITIALLEDTPPQPSPAPPTDSVMVNGVPRPMKRFL
jgi:hypothetical protein